MLYKEQSTPEHLSTVCSEIKCGGRGRGRRGRKGVCVVGSGLLNRFNYHIYQNFTLGSNVVLIIIIMIAIIIIIIIINIPNYGIIIKQ